MIVEERDYRLHPGKQAEFIRLYEAEGLAIQNEILGNMIGWFTSEIGELNHIVHMWGYQTFEDRVERRARMAADPRWQAYVPKIQPLIQVMNTRILIPQKFSPIR